MTDLADFTEQLYIAGKKKPDFKDLELFFTSSLYSMVYVTTYSLDYHTYHEFFGDNSAKFL